MTDQEENKDYFALLAASLAVAIVLFLVAIKTYAYLESGSASILASLVDSISDCAISVMSLSAIRYSLKPDDEDHRFGHGKIEGFAALFQAAFLSGAAVFVVFESLSRLTSPEAHNIENTVFSMMIMVASLILTLFLVVFQHRVLSRVPSLALEADKAHYTTDIAVNIGVIIVLIGLYMGMPRWLDPVGAIAIACYMLFAARDIGMKGADMLLDKELPGAAREDITRIVLTHDGVIDMHDLRTRRTGMRVIMAFDIEVEKSLSLIDAHEISRDVETELIKAFPNADIFIHVDPQGDTHDARHRIEGVHK